MFWSASNFVMIPGANFKDCAFVPTSLSINNPQSSTREGKYHTTGLYFLDALQSVPRRNKGIGRKADPIIGLARAFLLFARRQNLGVLSLCESSADYSEYDAPLESFAAREVVFVEVGLQSSPLGHSSVEDVEHTGILAGSASRDFPMQRVWFLRDAMHIPPFSRDFYFLENHSQVCSADCPPPNPTRLDNPALPVHFPDVHVVVLLGLLQRGDRFGNLSLYLVKERVADTPILGSSNAKIYMLRVMC